MFQYVFECIKYNCPVQMDGVKSLTETNVFLVYLFSIAAHSDSCLLFVWVVEGMIQMSLSRYSPGSISPSKVVKIFVFVGSMLVLKFKKKHNEGNLTQCRYLQEILISRRGIYDRLAFSPTGLTRLHI